MPRISEPLVLMSLGVRGHNLLGIIFYGVEAGTVVVNPLDYTIKKKTMVCRVVGGARGANGQAECLKDQILGRCFLGWKVE